MGKKPIKGLANAVEAQDAVPKAQMETAIAVVQDAVDALVVPSTSQTDFISGVIPALTNTDYRLIVKIPYGCTITETTTRCTSGTATGTFKINTTALDGTANSISSSEQSQSHSSANVVAAGDDIVLTISSNSSCLNLSFTIKFTRTLA